MMELLRDTIRLAGHLPRADDLACAAILKALIGDKKSISGSIQWVLLERIGRARIVDGREISQSLLRESLRAALRPAR